MLTLLLSGILNPPPLQASKGHCSCKGFMSCLPPMCQLYITQKICTGKKKKKMNALCVWEVDFLLVDCYSLLTLLFIHKKFPFFTGSFSHNGVNEFIINPSFSVIFWCVSWGFLISHFICLLVSRESYHAVPITQGNLLFLPAETQIWSCHHQIGKKKIQFKKMHLINKKSIRARHNSEKY